ncbi:hypothetical protein A3Q56_03346 [Intoshia linei]|uniref:TAFH domain-containing protein n=1 Tax=Intoshia linei TaxID=1819745 RepID=A0A177B3G5_9BILA|nr:hypothetical protein A3Q56_03346 [Intoshia linei]
MSNQNYQYQKPSNKISNEKIIRVANQNQFSTTSNVPQNIPIQTFNNQNTISYGYQNSNIQNPNTSRFSSATVQNIQVIPNHQMRNQVPQNIRYTVSRNYPSNSQIINTQKMTTHSGNQNYGQNQVFYQNVNTSKNYVPIQIQNTNTVPTNTPKIVIPSILLSYQTNNGIVHKEIKVNKNIITGLKKATSNQMYNTLTSLQRGKNVRLDVSQTTEFNKCTAVKTERSIVFSSENKNESPKFLLVNETLINALANSNNHVLIELSNSIQRQKQVVINSNVQQILQSFLASKGKSTIVKTSNSNVRPNMQNVLVRAPNGNLVVLNNQNRHNTPKTVIKNVRFAQNMNHTVLKNVLTTPVSNVKNYSPTQLGIMREKFNSPTNTIIQIPQINVNDNTIIAGLAKILKIDVNWAQEDDAKNSQKLKLFFQILLRELPKRKISVDPIKQLVQKTVMGKITTAEFATQLFLTLNEQIDPHICNFICKYLKMMRSRNHTNSQRNVQTNANSNGLVRVDNDKTIRQIVPNVNNHRFPVNITNLHNRVPNSQMIGVRNVQIRHVQNSQFKTGIKRPEPQKVDKPTDGDIELMEGDLTIDLLDSDVTKVGDINFLEEDKINHSHPAKKLKIQESHFVNIAKLRMRIVTVASEMGIKSVCPKVSEYLSKALKIQLTDQLERLTIFADHRIDYLKDDPDYDKTSETKEILKYLRTVEEIEYELQKDLEKDSILHMSNMNGNDSNFLEMKERAKQIRHEEQARFRDQEISETLSAAFGPRPTLSLSNDFAKKTVPRRIIILKDVIAYLDSHPQYTNSNLLKQLYMEE